MEGKAFDSRFKEYDDLLAGLSSDEDEKDNKKPNPSNTPIKDISKPNPVSKQEQSEKKPTFNQDVPNIQEKVLSKPVARIGDDYDDLLNGIDDEEVKEKKAPKPVDKPIHKQQGPPRDPLPAMIENEERFSNSKIIQTFLIIKSELDYLNEGLQRKTLDQRLLAHLKESRDQITSNKKNLEMAYQCGKLNGKSYLTVVERCMTEHQNLFKDAKALNDKSVLARLAKRLDLINKEKNTLKHDPNNEFIKLMKFINPNLTVDPNKKFQSEMPKSQSTAPVKVPKLPSDFHGRSNEELEEEQVDSLPQMKKVLFFKKRHKQYHNLALYFSKHMKDRKEQELNKVLIPKLQQGKKIIESLINGEDIKLAPILASDFQEITPETVQGEPDYQTQVQELQSKLQACIEEETNYYNSIFDIAKFRMKAEESKKKKAEYEKILKLAECIVADPWIPLPQVQIVQEARVLAVDNKDLDHTDMKLCFKQFLNCPHKNCFLSYFIEINGKTYKEMTEQADDHYNLGYEKMFKLGDSRKNIDKELYKKTINFNVLRKKFLMGTEEVGNGHIELRELLSNNRFEGKAQVTGKDKQFTLEFGIYLREPLRKEDKKFEVVKLLKTYPKFDVNEGVEEYLKQPIILNNEPIGGGQNVRPVDKQNVIEPVQEQNVIPEGVDINQIKVLRHSKNDPGFVAISQATIFPEGLTKEDALFVEDCEKCPCLSFIEQMIPKFQNRKVEFVKEYDKDASKYIEDQYNKYYKQSLVLPQKVENGQITPQDYKGLLEVAKKRDSKLLEFYQKQKALDWALFVKIRMAFLENEIKDIEQGLAGE